MLNIVSQTTINSLKLRRITLIDYVEKHE